MIDKRIIDFIKAHHLLTLATTKDNIPYCANCDQLYNIPESLVWTNIGGRKYGQSKVVADVDHRDFIKTVKTK